jgi:phosphatidylserine/phosphatidylglycerophosphate/cardiolipin synthase-like enzyme
VAEASGMEKQVARLLDLATDPARARITIAYFSFSNDAVFQKLCQKGKLGIPVEGFFDQSYRAADQYPMRLAKECQGPSAGNVRVHFLGKTDTSNPNALVWRLHHNKFLVVDPGGSQPVRVNFSSGNLSSSGLSIHFDHWAMVSAPRTSNLVRQQFCVIESLRRAVDPTGTGSDSPVDDPYAYRKALNSCLTSNQTLWRSNPSWVEQALTRERIAPLFAPDPSDSIAKVLVGNIDRVRKGGRVYGAIQHFLHTGIARALRAAVQRGVGVYLLMDDDVILGDSEVPGVREFFDKELDPAKTRLGVRFMQTNSGDHQMMHNKFLVLEKVDGSKSRVFSGAGHFTTSGMRNNYENFYLSQDSTLTKRYQALFQYMWPRAVEKKDVKKY